MPITARAWRFERTGGPEVLELAEHPVDPPGPGEALVEVRAIGLNRSDLMHLAGRYMAPPPSPSFLGQEAVGEVVALGPPAAGRSPVGGLELAVGSRVGLMVGRVDLAGMGTYRTVGRYRQDALLPCPEVLGDDEAAGFWLAALTALGGLRVGGLDAAAAAGRRVLVTAASSGVGVVALQAARGLGATTVAATTSPDKASRLEAIADHVVVGPPGQLAEAVLRATGGAGIDVALDPLGFAAAGALARVASTDGHIVFYGILAGGETPLDLRTMILKDLSLHGFTVYRLQRDPAALEEVVRSALELAARGALRPVVAAELPFTEAPQALAEMARNRHLGKIVLRVD